MSSSTLRSPFLDLPRPTKTYHDAPYAAISPSRPELNLSGKTVLVAGGATGIGLETSKAFAQAGAARVAILARREGPLREAKKLIEQTYPSAKVHCLVASMADEGAVKAALKNLGGTVDILVVNAAVVHAPAPVLEIDLSELRDNFEVNVLGALTLIKEFLSLPVRSEGAERTIIYTSSAGVHMQYPGVSGYSATKLAMTYLMSTIATEYGSKGLRTFTIHPAFGFTPMAERLGLKEGTMHFDDLALPAYYAVWLCSPEADFLKGRFLWAHWDVEELAAKKDAILADSNQLTISLVQDKVVEC